MIRRLLGRRVAAMDRCPGIHRGTWNPAVLGLPSAEVLNMASGGSGFFSPEDGDSSSNLRQAAVAQWRATEKWFAAAAAVSEDTAAASG